jgi:hypothetical protein
MRGPCPNGGFEQGRRTRLVGHEVKAGILERECNDSSFDRKAAQGKRLRGAMARPVPGASKFIMGMAIA